MTELNDEEKKSVLRGEAKRAVLSLRNRIGLTLKEASNQIKDFKISEGIIAPYKIIGDSGERVKLSCFISFSTELDQASIVKIISDKIGMSFSKDTSGHYEEFETYYSHCLGMKFIIQLNTPREIEKTYIFEIESNTIPENGVFNIDISSQISGLLKEIRELEVIENV